MKYFAILLSVYMTFLALMPCQDKDDKVDFSNQTTVSKQKACNEQGGQESCPPFCTCNCCSTTRCIAVQSVTSEYIQEFVNDYPAYQIQVVQQQGLDIWQPPQIA
jgi:hypothetical protein